VAVEAVRLSKRYGEVIALADLDLAIHAGEIYSLLGPNGAGKTTTLSLLLGLLRPSGGHDSKPTTNPVEPSATRHIQAKAFAQVNWCGWRT
jgi:ABC-type multidrug transport system ATPase subunit